MDPSPGFSAMTNPHTWLLYGANGYTGRRIAEEAVRRGHRPVLAGRRAEEIEPLAGRLGCPARVFDLARPEEIARQLQGLRAVLHCAGPFSRTAEPMIAACLAAGVHYLDITGEIDVIEAAAARDGRAMTAGVALLPAVGFDVVPSDCLAALLLRKLPRATHFELGFTGTGTISPGTARTMVEHLPSGGRIRRDGRLEHVPLAWQSRTILFRDGPQTAVTVPWGDVASAYHTTGVPNIEVYMAMSQRQIQWLRRLRPLVGLLTLPWPEPLVAAALRWFVLGATDAPAEEPPASLWGRMSDRHGQSVEATLTTPGAYRLTVLAALACTARVLVRRVPPGFNTPAKAFGPELVFELPDTELQWEAG